MFKNQCDPSYYNNAYCIQDVDIDSSATISYLLTSTIPSNSTSNRVWNFTCAGISSTRRFSILADYEKAKNNCPIYNISFTQPPQGFLIIKNEVISAEKTVRFIYKPPYTLLLEICIPKSCFIDGNDNLFFFSIYVKDAADKSQCTLKYDSIIPQICGNEYTRIEYNGIDSDIIVTQNENEFSVSFSGINNFNPVKLKFTDGVSTFNLNFPNITNSYYSISNKNEKLPLTYLAYLSNLNNWSANIFSFSESYNVMNNSTFYYSDGTYYTFLSFEFSVDTPYEIAISLQNDSTSLDVFGLYFPLLNSSVDSTSFQIQVKNPPPNTTFNFQLFDVEGNQSSVYAVPASDTVYTTTVSYPPWPTST